MALTLAEQRERLGEEFWEIPATVSKPERSRPSVKNTRVPGLTHAIAIH